MAGWGEAGREWRTMKYKWGYIGERELGEWLEMRENMRNERQQMRERGGTEKTTTRGGIIESGMEKEIIIRKRGRI